ncbi:MAG: hypothetical protein HKN52_01470 [Eudoraea sp.]|nr:hypothetical protein [Eudoraea sp.]
MIIISKHFFYKNYVGLSLWPFIILREVALKKDEILINHERIHLKQQKELLIVPFYLLYFFEWAIRTLWYFNGYTAYQNMSFEREAYANEDDLDYIEKRASYAFIKYLWL